MANYPSSQNTDTNLYLAVNNLSTVLTDNPLTAGATTVNVSDASSFPTVGIITIDLEAIHYTGTTATSFTGCTRGFDGTTGASHALNATVFHDIPAAHHNVFKEEIKAVTDDLRDGFTADLDDSVTPAVTATDNKQRLDHIVTQVKNVTGETDWKTAPANTITTLDGSVTNLSSYRRPNLIFGSVTTVAVESGLNGTSGDVEVLFPDATLRTTNNTTLTTFDITRNAVLSGSKQSGLRTGTEATDTWYALYAVKATDSSDIVTVGDTVLPLQANFATLNSNFGTDGWVYLGMIRNGDNSGATGDILSFEQSGGLYFFTNSATGLCEDGMGIRLAASASAASVTYSFTQGTGTTDIPNQIRHTYMAACSGTVAGNAIFRQSSGARPYFSSVSNTDGAVFQRFWQNISIGTQAASGVSSKDIFISGYIDRTLNSGSNAVL